MAPARFGLFRLILFHSSLGGLEVRAAVPLTVASIFSNALHHGLTSMKVIEIPGPLPIPDAAAA
ncbi:MAG: hypothetical protein VKN13_06440 [Cyanobacteriota bacterium]|nr:hypothetical protein [Cyanobacteriota bacterium]